MNKPNDRLTELREQLATLDGQISEASMNKTAIWEKRRELEAKKSTEYSDAVDIFKMNELAATGGNLVDKTLKSKTFDKNSNLELSIAKLRGAYEAVCRQLNDLSLKRKGIASEIATLEAKSRTEALLKTHKALLAAVTEAVRAHSTFIALLNDAPSDVASLAGRLPETDDFFVAAVSRKPRPGENLIDYISWATSRGIKGNSLHGSAPAKGKFNDFRQGHTFNGFSINNH